MKPASYDEKARLKALITVAGASAGASAGEEALPAEALLDIVALVASFDPDSGGVITEAALQRLGELGFGYFWLLAVALRVVAATDAQEWLEANNKSMGRYTARAALLWKKMNKQKEAT